MNFTKSVVIIGGGASGVLTGVNLAQRSSVPLRVTVICPGKIVGSGIAFSQDAESHLLNVVAEKMSAFPDEHDHFVKWLISSRYSEFHSDTLSKSFLPRTIYGEYLFDVWKRAGNHCSEGTEIIAIEDRAVDVRRNGESNFTVVLTSGKELNAQYVVLAISNALPRNPEITDKSFYQSAKYFNNPWDRSVTEELDCNKDVLLIGNGLTMVDTVVSLTKKKLKGVINSISPHGFSILPHRNNGITYNGFVKEMDSVKGLTQYVALFNKHVKKIRGLGLSAETIVDSLRPVTQSVWMSLTECEKKKFIARLRHMWGAMRHRLPAQHYDLIQKLKADGKLKIWAGSISDLTLCGNEVAVSFYERKTKSPKMLTVSRVINCTGPELDIERINDPLFKNLIRRNFISSDPFKMGLLIDPVTFQLLDPLHNPVPNFFALGALLRGVLWETTAIPEIRNQARQIADRILGSINN
ncbi:FAD/NAD(P)-binding protein [soil metagenome]